MTGTKLDGDDQINCFPGWLIIYLTQVSATDQTGDDDNVL
jgi:hypothetical protein